MKALPLAAAGLVLAIGAYVVLRPRDPDADAAPTAGRVPAAVDATASPTLLGSPPAPIAERPASSEPAVVGPASASPGDSQGALLARIYAGGGRVAVPRAAKGAGPALQWLESADADAG